MRESVLSDLACPDCSGDLTIAEASSIAGGWIETGALACRSCGERFPIDRGVPNFVGSEESSDVVQTTSGFARNWNDFSPVILDHEELNETLFRDWIAPVEPESFTGRLILEPGCGMGRWLRIAARHGPRCLIGVDYSEVAYTAADNVRDLENVHVLRADILRLPLKKRVESIYCLGVIHHTPDPARTFAALVRVLAEDGLMTSWVYGAESNGWLERFVSPVRTRVTSRLPHAALGALSFATALPLYAAAWLSERMPLPYRQYLRHLSRYPFSYMRHIVYDHLVPSIAHYLPRAELERWVVDNGLHGQLSPRNGNSWKLLVSRSSSLLPKVAQTGT